MLTVDESAHGQTIALRVGESFEIRLPENRTTGFRWAVELDENGPCELSEEGFEAPSAASGDAGVHRWRFRAVRAGSATIELASRRPWEDGTPPSRRFALTVEASD